ncbi:hypothetical protein LCGC14_0705980 [marine sediment metagenome]|uniref:Uncharacterized protein n=1 Tax=marine sediment metagenome TaxID=412755 RepID=A0A0F9R1U3_9ZZZZ|nr:hypothetical protein [bacterium]
MNIEESLENYFPGTKTAIDMIQEEFTTYLNRFKIKKFLNRDRDTQVLKTLLRWLSPYVDIRYGTDPGFLFQNNHYLITDLINKRKGSCVAFTSLFLGLARRMSIDVWAANVLITSQVEHLKYDPIGHICVIDKNKKQWDCIYLAQHKTIQVLTDDKFISLILTNQSTNEDDNETELNLLNESIRLDSQNIHALLNLGVYYNKNNFHPKKSLEMYDRVLKIDPFHARAWRRKAEQYEDIGDNIEAISCYQKSDSIYPTEEVLFKLINLYVEKKDYDRALLACKKFLEINPNHVGIIEKFNELKKNTSETI